MYGKEVDINGIKVWVPGIPSMTEAEWREAAISIIKEKLRTA